MAFSTEVSSHDVLFLGHSYIRRFSEYIFSGKNRKVDATFGLKRDHVTAYFHGIGGARVARIQHEFPKVMAVYRPYIVILHIGGNDILHNSDDMDKLAQKVFNVAHDLHTVYGVQQVIVSQLLSQRKARCTDYHSLVVQLNLKLAQKITEAGLSGIVFQKHIGFWSPKARAEVQHEDGVHLNDLGNYKLYESFKSAIIQAIQRMG